MIYPLHHEQEELPRRVSGRRRPRRRKRLSWPLLWPRVSLRLQLFAEGEVDGGDGDLDGSLPVRADLCYSSFVLAAPIVVVGDRTT